MIFDDIKVSCLRYSKEFKPPKEGTSMKVLSINEIIPMELGGDLCNYCSMSDSGLRLCGEYVERFDMWSGLVCEDIDYKNFKLDNKPNVKALQYIIHNYLLKNFRNIYAFSEISRSGDGLHFFFYFKCKHDKDNFISNRKIAFYAIDEAFENSNLKYIIQTEGVHDTCTLNLSQCVYITKFNMMENKYCDGHIMLYSDIMRKIRLENDKKELIDNRKRKYNYKSEYKYNVVAWNPPSEVCYISHKGSGYSRWNLFDSLSKIFTDDEKLFEEWDKCCEFIPCENGHSTQFYKDEPHSNKWINRLSGDEYCNFNLLRMFGYEIEIEREHKTCGFNTSIFTNILKKGNEESISKQN